MKIVDNRYKIENIMHSNAYFEYYKATDLWKDDKDCFLTIYHYDMQNELIEYFIKKFINLTNIKHKNILQTEKFNIVKSINKKDTNILLYYSISEYSSDPTLDQVIMNLKLEEKLEILIQIILVLDFLHYKGITYEFLNPSQIFISKDKGVKIQSLGTIVEKKFNSRYTDFEKKFISSGFTIGNIKDDIRVDIRVDYYSLGMLIEYLFLEEKNLLKEQRDLLLNISKDLTKRNYSKTVFNLIEILNQIIEVFKLDYTYDLTEYRDELFFKSETVGREKEIAQILKIDDDIHNGINSCKGMLIRGDLGMGKSRLLAEISYRLKMKGRDVYSIKINENSSNGLLDISNVLKQSIKDTPEDLIEKYRDEFSAILPELSLDTGSINSLDFNLNTERYRIYNRISNYLKDFSKDRIIYIIIDDIQNSGYDFLQLLSYLLNSAEISKVFLIFSYEYGLKLKTDKINIINIIKGWLTYSNVIDVKLHNFDLEEIGVIIKNILGIGASHIDFASVLFRKTQGNPREIEYLVKYLYDIGQFYMNEKGAWHLTVDDYSEMYVPTNFDEVTLKQLNLIKDKYYKIFKLMSIFDDFLHKDMLLEMLKIGAEDLEIKLKELIQLRLIDEKLVDWGYSYNIKNIEIKNLIYFELPEKEKTSLHKSAVESFLNLEIDNKDYIFEKLIYHLIKSGQSKRALNKVLEKVKELDNIYGSRGIYLFKKAYGIAKNIDDIVKLHILEKLTKIYFVKGKLGEINIYLKEYEELSKKLNEFGHLINAEAILAEIYYIRSQLNSYLEQIEKIKKLAEDKNIIDGKIVALSLKSRAYLDKRENDHAEKVLYKGIKLSEEYGIEEYMGDLYNRLGIVKLMKGDIINAIEFYKKSINFFYKTGNVIGATKPINNIGHIYAEHNCNPKKAIEEYEKGLAITKKYNIKHQEIYFLNNLASVSLIDYKHDKAFKYLLEANENAIKLQDLYSMFVSYYNLGKFYLYESDYYKAYECYKYVNEIYQSGNVTNPEALSGYYDFMVEFYISLGQWDKANKYCIKFKSINKESNGKDYLKSSYKSLLIKYLKNGYFNKVRINNLIASYKDTLYLQDTRELLLVFSFISLIEGDMGYTLEMLKEDEKLKDTANNEFLNKIRDTIVCYLDSDRDKLDKLISMEEYFENNNKFPVNLLIKMGVGSKLYAKHEYQSAIKYFMESLDIIYKDMLKIPDLNFRFSFIGSRQTDAIKVKLVRAIKRGYGETIKISRLKDTSENQLNFYFDISPVLDVIGSEEFSEIFKLDSYGEVSNIIDSEELVSKLTNDFEYNLDLIIKYISKETLANRGFILEYDEEAQKYNIIKSFNDIKNYKINENLLRLSDRTEEGLLINKDMLNEENQEYRELLSENIRGIICVPISMDTEYKTYSPDRRKRYENKKPSLGYIYLETDKVFNRFNKEKLKSIFRLVYLLYANLENNKLIIEATTDKLTGIYTRKYYEKVFEEFINYTKTNDESFSFLMLDIDKFKNVNDRYGHRKGDEVLREIGKTLKSCVRSTDIVSRYGGEEFTILLKNVEKVEAKNIAEKIRKAVEGIKVKGIDIPITISIGISIFPFHSQFKEELMEKADQALYYAKETGRNKVCFWDHSMSDSFNRADKLAGILTGSTESDNRNILAIIDIIDLIQGKKDLEYKSFEFLGRLLDVIETEQATLIVFKNDQPNYYSRVKFSEEWSKTPVLNEKIINRVKENKKGEFLIDWDSIDDIDSLSGIPNWESIIVLPLIEEEDLKGIVYLSSPLKTKEFDFNSYNLAKSFADIFSAIL